MALLPTSHALLLHWIRQKTNLITDVFAKEHYLPQTENCPNLEREKYGEQMRYVCIVRLNEPQ